MPVGSVIRRVEGRPVRTQALLCELLAAKAAGIPIVPVYSGQRYSSSQIKALIKPAFADDTKCAAAKALFRENLIDVLNPEHNAQCLDDFKRKVSVQRRGRERRWSGTRTH